jgi:hypothetical protein
MTTSYRSAEGAGLENEDEAPGLYGVMGEFDSAGHLLAATRRAYAAGYRHMDAFTPFPIEDLGDALGLRTNAIPLIGLFGGIAGAITGFGMQLWIHTSALPINVGGRPLDSWPAFIPVTFELTVLFSALAMLAGLFILNGLPEPYHPVFNVASFARASRDRFFLTLQADDPRFEWETARQFLHDLGAMEVSDVAP